MYTSNFCFWKKNKISRPTLEVNFQFGMGRDTLVAMYSMNECEECEVDPRPNLFDKPLTNWAHQTLDGWNIHHTTEVNSCQQK